MGLFGFGKKNKQKEEIEENIEEKPSYLNSYGLAGSSSEQSSIFDQKESDENSVITPEVEESNIADIADTSDADSSVTTEETVVEEQTASVDSSIDMANTDSIATDDQSDDVSLDSSLADEMQSLTDLNESVDSEELEEADDTADIEDKPKKGFFSKLVSGLTKTRKNIADSFSSVFSANHIDEDFYEELEETLIMADMGVSTTMNILDELREKVKKQHIKEPIDCKDLLIDIIKDQMSLEPSAYEYENRQSVVMVIGVNGVGKTTSIGKLAAQFRKDGKKVMMAAADTFRAAAIEQLEEWAHRSQVDIIAQSEGTDPSAVVFDACQAAKARKTDILLVDTAGRLHNKKNLMTELSKMNKIIDREYPDAYRETLIVLDGTTGQNALEQAKQFKEVADIDGIVLTKLDGTAKGGIAIAIHAELGVPVKYIGVGEGIWDLQKFDPEAYVNAIFNVDSEEAEDVE